MVLENVLISFFTCSCPVIPAPLIEETIFSHCISLLPLLYINWPQVCEFISVLSILFHWSIFLFLCPYCTVLSTVILWYSLMSGSLIPPALFFSLRTALAHWSLLCFTQLKKFFYSSFVKNSIGNFIGISLNLYIALTSIVILTILLLPIQEHSISHHLFVSSAVFLISILQFWGTVLLSP